MLFFIIFTFLLVAVRQASAALTAAQITSCANSITLPEFQDTVTYDVNDRTSYSVVYAYDYASCNGVPILESSVLEDVNGASYTCTYSAFDATETFTSVCQVTQGTLATRARDTGTTFDTKLLIGKSGLKKVTSQTTFTVVPSDASTSTSSATSPAPTPSGNLRKRTISVLAEDGTFLGTRSIDDDDSAMCDKGYTACPVKDRKGFHQRCVNTSKNLFSCGGCAGTPEHQDCSDIDGVANVQCVSGQCQIKTCDRLHKISADGKTCVRKVAGFKKRAYDS